MHAVEDSLGLPDEPTWRYFSQCIHHLGTAQRLWAPTSATTFTSRVHSYRHGGVPTSSLSSLTRNSFSSLTHGCINTSNMVSTLSHPATETDFVASPNPTGQETCPARSRDASVCNSMRNLTFVVGSE